MAYAVELPFGIDAEEMKLQFTTNGTADQLTDTVPHSLHVELDPANHSIAYQINLTTQVTDRKNNPESSSLDACVTDVVTGRLRSGATKYFEAFPDETIDGEKRTLALDDFSTGREPEDLEGFVLNGIAGRISSLDNVEALNLSGERQLKKKTLLALGVTIFGGLLVTKFGIDLSELQPGDTESDVSGSIGWSGLLTVVSVGATLSFNNSRIRFKGARLAAQEEKARLGTTQEQINTNGIRLVGSHEPVNT